MPIIFRCHHCQQKLSIASRKAGQNVDCPACGKVLSVPLDDTVDAPATPEPGELEHREEKVAVSKVAASAVSRPAEEQREEDDEQPLTFRKADTEGDEMDLTPMVDVTFLLLIFFMITASFSIQKKFDIPNPKPKDDAASNEPVDPEELQKIAVMVVIDEKNEITVDEEPVPDISQLRDIIERKMRTDQKSELMLRAHAMALHEYSVKVIDAANGAEIQKIHYGTIGSLDFQ